jgi:hypothetical protein
MIRFFTAIMLTAVIGSFPALAQNTDKDKNVDVRSPIGDLHVGKDADALKAGLPIYPGARTQHTDRDDPVNLAISTENFGMKLIVAKYETEDPPEKVLAFYRERMKKGAASTTMTTIRTGTSLSSARVTTLDPSGN